MPFHVQLRNARIAAGMTQQEIANILQITKSTYCGYETAKRQPDPQRIKQIAKILNVSADQLLELDEVLTESPAALSAEAMEVAQRFDTLDEWGKDVIDTILAKESARCTAQKARAARQSTEESREMGAESALYYFPMYDSPMSAGTGLLAGQEPPKTTPLVKEPPHGASYIAPVSGDSMEPTYSDGDLLFIQATPAIEVGQVGVFLMDSQQWVKELGRGRLISHNRAYAPIPMTEDIVCQGLVLGVCDESYFQ